MTHIRNTWPMAFDRWDGDQFIHATGREVLIDGIWTTEYEDSPTVDMPTTDADYIEGEEN